LAIAATTWLAMAVWLSGCTSGPMPPAGGSVTPAPTATPTPQANTEQLPVLVGTVLSVTDGDTIKVQLSSGPISVRFHSIDAPEKNQPWGMKARAALASRLERQQVSLDVDTQDRYERLVATVYLGDENINAWMVQEGHAWAYRDYLKDPQYCHSEADARARRLGLWNLPPIYAPWEWRAYQRDSSQGFSDYSGETASNCIAAMHGRRASTRSAAVTVPAEVPSTANTGCRIKGNISQNGRIYHVPGSPSYEQTKIDESKGERWFCSEVEARAGGWRAPR
jgi:endonuclease YncB( thermonuclease family)